MRYNPDKVIKTLEQFIDEKQQNTGDLNEDQKKKKKIENEKKEKEVMKEKKYWDKMTKVLPHERVQMWNVIFFTYKDIGQNKFEILSAST